WYRGRFCLRAASAVAEPKEDKAVNPTTQKLRAQYARRFIVAAACIAAAAATAHLLMLGRTGEHSNAALGLCAVCGLLRWTIGVTLGARRKVLRQCDVLQRLGPYGNNEVAPQEATSKIGDADGANMWA